MASRPEVDALQARGSHVSRIARERERERESLLYFEHEL